MNVAAISMWGRNFTGEEEDVFIETDTAPGDKNQLNVFFLIRWIYSDLGLCHFEHQRDDDESQRWTTGM